MRALSLRQANRCETAKNKVCRCRCGGALHGAARDLATGREREFFEELPADDPHHLPTKAERKQKRKDRAYVRKSGPQTFLWPIEENV